MEFFSIPSGGRDWMREIFLREPKSHMADAFQYASSAWTSEKPLCVDPVFQFHVNLTEFDKRMLHQMMISIS
jgi:hypothetical protein